MPGLLGQRGNPRVFLISKQRYCVSTGVATVVTPAVFPGGIVAPGTGYFSEQRAVSILFFF
jgi:hypothetical protein